MPELPDVTVYVERLQARVQGRVLRDLRLRSPFVLRTVDPPVSEAVGGVVTGGCDEASSQWRRALADTGDALPASEKKRGHRSR